MNSTSPSARLLTSAARSPARSSAGPAGDADAGAELGRDDHGQRGLAEPGRARTAARGPAAGRGGGRSRAPARPARAPAAARRTRRAGAGAAPPRRPAPGRRRRAARARRSPRAASSASSRATSSSSLTGALTGAPSWASAARSSTGTSSSDASGWLGGEPVDDLVGLRGRPAEPDERLRQRVAPARRLRHAGDDRRAGQAGLVLELEHHAAARPCGRCRAPGTARRGPR